MVQRVSTVVPSRGQEVLLFTPGPSMQALIYKAEQNTYMRFLFFELCSISAKKINL